MGDDKKPFCVLGGECIGNVPTIKGLGYQAFDYKQLMIYPGGGGGYGSNGVELSSVGNKFTVYFKIHSSIDIERGLYFEVLYAQMYGSVGNNAFKLNVYRVPSTSPVMGESWISIVNDVTIYFTTSVLFLVYSVMYNVNINDVCSGDRLRIEFLMDQSDVNLEVYECESGYFKRVV